MPFRSSCSTPCQLVAPADLERIHTAALEVMRRAEEKARAILAQHQVTPLPPEVDREIEALLAAAAREKAGA